MASTKRCAVCKVEQSVGNFGPDKAKNDGLRSYCLECDRRLARERAQKAKERVKVFVAEKLCPDCNMVKPRSEFYNRSNHSDGLTTYCKECTAKRNMDMRKILKSKEPTVEHKVCPQCSCDKPASDFYLSPKRGDGLSWVCKTCTRKQANAWAKSNPERKHENDVRKGKEWVADGRGALKNREYALRHPDRVQEKQKKYRASHHEHINDYMKLYRQRRPEVSRRAAQKWTKNNPIKNRLKVHRRNTRKLELPFNLTEQDVEDIYELFENECGFCGAGDTKMTLEHVVPLIRKDVPNPGTVRGNLMPLCKPCNSSKGDKLLEEYLLDPKMVRPQISEHLQARDATVGDLVTEIRFFLYMLK
jgi:5-methylcytosine-specific restriction endonuclease McrA